MKKVFVGRYTMNNGLALLWLDPNEVSSQFWHCNDPKEGPVLKIEVGTCGKSWAQVVMAMLHEFVEASAMRERCHFNPSRQYMCPTDAYLMVMSHPQFTQVVNEAGDARAYALDDARKAFGKLKKKEKAK